MELLLLLPFVLYLLPWMVAVRREHPQSHWILALVGLLGWTVLGWIVAMRWAREEPPEPVGLRVLDGGRSDADEPDPGPQTRVPPREPPVRLVRQR